MPYQYKAIPLPPPSPTPPDAPLLDARLAAAIPFIRGDCMADVGTDHAYLPIVLLRRGLCDFAVATDIHKGPAEIAAAHLSAHGIDASRATVLLTDGLHGAEAFFPRDICIFGMGGEMIAHILDEAPWVKDPSVRLILQPMTKQEKLRVYLAEHGFAIREERLVKTDRIYQLLCAEYDGTPHALTPAQALLGAQNLARRDELTLQLVVRQCEILQATLAGKAQSATADTTQERALLQELTQYLNI